MDLSAHEVEIPIPISSSTYVGQSHGHPIIHHENHNHPSNGSHPLSIEDQNQNQNHNHNHNNNIKKASLVVKYRECLKNHAASIGGNATDGCGEFMPSGEEGTLEALKCSACNCHRNFHRKEIGGEPNSSCTDCFHHLKIGRKFLGGQKGVLISSSSDLIPRPTPHNMIMPLGAAAIQTSESDEMGGYYPRPNFVKKRFRTKFSAEQKAKMLAFAERVGWKLQKQEESVVQQLCQEIGVKRRVLKVWMHNNKHNLAKKANNITSSNLNESAQTGIADSRGGLI